MVGRAVLHQGRELELPGGHRAAQRLQSGDAGIPRGLQREGGVRQPDLLLHAEARCDGRHSLEQQRHGRAVQRHRFLRGPGVAATDGLRRRADVSVQCALPAERRRVAVCAHRRRLSAGIGQPAAARSRDRSDSLSAVRPLRFAVELRSRREGQLRRRPASATTSRCIASSGKTCRCSAASWA